MNNWCICWFFTRIFTMILNFKGLAVRRLYKSFGVKGVIINACIQIGTSFSFRYSALKLSTFAIKYIP
jgi:hypothetical protein